MQSILSFVVNSTIAFHFDTNCVYLILTLLCSTLNASKAILIDKSGMVKIESLNRILLWLLIEPLASHIFA